MRSRREANKEAVRTLVRVWREGGTGTASLPDPKTGAMVEGAIDQPAAEAFMAYYLDSILSDLWQAIRQGNPLSSRDRRVLKTCEKGLPESFHWVWTPDDQHFLLPLNVTRDNCSKPPEWLVLAAHPLEYDVEWSVPVPAIGRDGLRTGRVIFVCCAEDRDTILARWTRLEALNADLWAKRRSK